MVAVRSAGQQPAQPAPPVPPANVAAQRPAPPAPDGVALLNGKDLTGWVLKNEQHKDTWRAVSKVHLDPDNPKKLVGIGESGGLLFRQPVEHGSDIYTREEFGDCELHIEVLVPVGSNSGIYLMGQYEVQVFDSFRKPDGDLKSSDMGGIYSLSAPQTNACAAPGQWQTFDIVFRAPRFDGDGTKLENARFISVTLNGKKVQENIEAPKPTGGELSSDERATGPLMLQGDHGVVAYRNIRIRPAR
ncbi:MAG: DUF1080 domain-containing protein [Planctomycetota bacterium]